MTIAPGTLLAHRYRAEAVLGRGGMGEVWRCRDVEQGHDVAIKAVKAELLSDPGTARLFHNEVVAVARLNHPGIVPVYDLLREPGAGALLVMELRGGVHLGAFSDGGPSWTALRAVLAQILEALAYAHARGVLHLDIKPENVLVERTSAGPRVTLLDFGIARVRRPGRGVERWFDRDAVVGTVEYMAPEQCAGTFERFGPWSDLFSVGAVAFELCAGYRPFPGAADPVGLLRRLGEPPPRLVPAVSGVPAGFADLCAALLAIEPRDRPASAADVLAALRALEGAAPGSVREREIAERRGALTEGHPILRADAPTVELGTGEQDPRGAGTATSSESRRIEAALRPTATFDSVDVPRAAHGAPAIPPVAAAIAAHAVTAEASAPPAGAYGLFGLRDLPVLGRTEERRAVWSAVYAAAIERRTRVVLLEGPAGVGKSRLARDAMEHAVELGLCSALQTSWSAEGSGDEGLRGLLENLLDTRGAPAPQVRARLDFWLDRIGALRSAPAQVRAFVREVELLLRPPRDAAPDAGLPLRVVMEALTRASAVRPVLLWLDDVQWSRGEATALFEALRVREPQLPVCVIASVRTEEVEDRASYELFAATSGTERVAVERLDLEATRRLVRGLLDVDEQLCDFLSARAEGNPLFVSLMLRQLVLAEVVERRDGRYRLTGSFDLSAAPADIDALWRRRVEQSGVSQRELAALALVRERVSFEVGDELSRILGPALEAAIGRGLTSGVLHIEGSAYVWEHGLLREYLVKSVAAADAPAFHAAAAAALGPLVDREDVQEERAHHLYKADRVREACEAMLHAGLWSQRRAESAPRKARFERLTAWARDARLLHLAARGLAELGFAHAEVGDAKRAAEALAGARLLLERGAGAEAASWVALRASQAARLQGRVDEGARASEEALASARRAGVGEVERLALLQLGVDCCRNRNVAEGRRILGEAAERSRAAGDPVAESIALRTLADIAEPAAALPLVERSIELARSAGALRIELGGKQVWVNQLWRSGARETARREASELASEAGRRALRQTVSLIELQSAAWAAGEDDWDDARIHRDAAAKWGAASGGVAERLVLLAVDVALALAARDEPAAQTAVETLERTRGAFDDGTFRDLLARAATLATGPLHARLRHLIEPAGV